MLSKRNRALVERFGGEPDGFGLGYISIDCSEANLNRLLDAARAEGGAGAGLAAGTHTPPVQQPRASLSHLVPELTRALRKIAGFQPKVPTGARGSYQRGYDIGFNGAGTYARDIALAALSQAEQASGLCVEPSKEPSHG